MAGILRNIIVVAMGAGALGGPDALGLLLEFAGRSPVVDVAIAVFVIAAVTAPALGTMLLARFFRKSRSSSTGGGAARSGSGAGAAGAMPADPFAKMTLVLSLAIAFLVSASLLVLTLVQSEDLVPRGAVGMLVAPAQRLLALALNNPLASLPVGVATATVVGATLVALFLPRAQNAATTAGGGHGVPPHDDLGDDYGLGRRFPPRSLPLAVPPVD